MRYKLEIRFYKLVKGKAAEFLGLPYTRYPVKVG